MSFPNSALQHSQVKDQHQSPWYRGRNSFRRTSRLFSLALFVFIFSVLMAVPALAQSGDGSPSSPQPGAGADAGNAPAEAPTKTQDGHGHGSGPSSDSIITGAPSPSFITTVSVINGTTQTITITAPPAQQPAPTAVTLPKAAQSILVVENTHYGKVLPAAGPIDDKIESHFWDQFVPRPASGSKSSSSRLSPLYPKMFSFLVAVAIPAFLASMFLTERARR